MRETNAGLAGSPLGFDAEITSKRPNELLAWKSIGRGPVRHAGIVRFQEEDGGTRVDLQMTYNPPLGATGHAIASLFGSDPKHALDDDILRFKSLIEEGKTSAHGHEVHRDDVTSAMASQNPDEQWQRPSSSTTTTQSSRCRSRVSALRHFTRAA